MLKPPPYPAFTTNSRISTRTIRKVFCPMLVMPWVRITSPVAAMERMKIIL